MRNVLWVWWRSYARARVVPCVDAMIRTFLNFGSTRKRCLLTQKSRIYGPMREETAGTVGYGMLRTKPTTGENTSTFTKIFNPSLITTVPIFGSWYTNKTVSKGLSCSSRCVWRRRYCSILSVGCIRVFRLIWVGFIRIVLSRVLGLIWGLLLSIISFILIIRSIRGGCWIILRELGIWCFCIKCLGRLLLLLLLIWRTTLLFSLIILLKIWRLKGTWYRFWKKWRDLIFLMRKRRL